VLRLVRVSGAALSALLLLASIAIWDAAFRTPSPNLLPLADGLIPIASSSGQALLAEKRFIADYERLTQNFESQSRPAFCGVASSVVVLNALRSTGPRVTQSTFFTDAASKVRGSLQVTFAGMSLAQLGNLLRAHGLEVTLFYASDTPVDAFRSIARENLRTSGDFLLVNYQRAALGQGEIGHISPLAAYNAASDRSLILDVAAYKYPPVWVSAAALWNAMNTTDSSSDRTRGFIVVKNGDPSRATTPPGQAHGSPSR
jgi:hypothetical protein